MPAAWFDPNMTKSELIYTFEIQGGPRGRKSAKGIASNVVCTKKKRKNGKRTVEERNEWLLNEMNN